MAMGWLRKRKILLGLMLFFLLLGGGVAWVARHDLLAWYCLRGLTQATEGDRDLWVERAVCLGEPVVPGLVESLAQACPVICGNTQATLKRFAEEWGPTDPRGAALAHRLGRCYSRCSPTGQRCTLQIASQWFHKSVLDPTPGLVPACTRLLTEAASSTDPEIQAAALNLSELLLNQPWRMEALSAARDVIQFNLRSEQAANRLQAVKLSLQPGLDLIEQVVRLMQDPVAEVRRVALLVVGTADASLVPNESLLPSLHDADGEVRQLCERVLLARGLQPRHLLLGRLLTHPNPVHRLVVLDHLQESGDLDLGLWLRRLSHDHSPAVRAAALRVMSTQDHADLSDRIDQMARSDPSPTICQLARFYQTQIQNVPRTR